MDEKRLEEVTGGDLAELLEQAKAEHVFRCPKCTVYSRGKGMQAKCPKCGSPMAMIIS